MTIYSGQTEPEVVNEAAEVQYVEIIDEASILRFPVTILAGIGPEYLEANGYVKASSLGGLAFEDLVDTAQLADEAVTPAKLDADTQTELLKLAGIAAGATANAPDSYLLKRSNHTGSLSADELVDGSTNKVFTSGEQQKLGGIENQATRNTGALADQSSVQAGQYAPASIDKAALSPAALAALGGRPSVTIDFTVENQHNSLVPANTTDLDDLALEVGDVIAIDLGSTPLTGMAAQMVGIQYYTVYATAAALGGSSPSAPTSGGSYSYVIPAGGILLNRWHSKDFTPTGSGIRVLPDSHSFVDVTITKVASRKEAPLGLGQHPVLVLDTGGTASNWETGYAWPTGFRAANLHAEFSDDGSIMAQQGTDAGVTFQTSWTHPASPDKGSIDLVGMNFTWATGTATRIAAVV